MLVTLRKGARWVEFETKINNNVPNHYLQVSFPTDIDTEFVYAQGQFDVVSVNCLLIIRYTMKFR